MTEMSKKKGFLCFTTSLQTSTGNHTVLWHSSCEYSLLIKADWLACACVSLAKKDGCLAL